MTLIISYAISHENKCTTNNNNTSLKYQIIAQLNEIATEAGYQGPGVWGPGTDLDEWCSVFKVFMGMAK